MNNGLGAAMGDDMGVVIPLGCMAAINRAAEAERVKAQLENDLEAAGDLRRQKELRLSIVIREAVKELADAQAKEAFCRHRIETMFPPLGGAA